MRDLSGSGFRGGEADLASTQAQWQKRASNLTERFGVCGLGVLAYIRADCGRLPPGASRVGS